MQVYKAFYKVIYKNLSEIIIYVFVFLIFAVFLGNQPVDPAEINFEETKINIAFINQDDDSDLVKGFKNYLEDHTTIVPIAHTKEDLQDALYFREVEYILSIPKGFTEEVLSQNNVLPLDRSTAPNSVSSVYIDNVVNKYMNTLKLYTSTLPELSEQELVSYISDDLADSTEVEMSAGENSAIMNSNAKNYFNYLAYSLSAILILGVCTVMATFNEKGIQMRNAASALSLKSMSAQLVLGNITFAIAVWAVMIVASLVLYGNYMFSANGLLFLLNSFVFTLAALSISLLIGNVISSRNAMSAAANVVALGTCFLSGVFVPQDYLSDTVISIAKFSPTYWYVLANNEIALLPNHSLENLTPIFINMLIVLMFSFAIIGITLVVLKHKRIKQS